MKSHFLYAVLVLPLLALAEAPLIELVNDGLIRWQCVEVIDGEDVPKTGHVTQEKAESCLIDQKLKHPDRDFRAVGKHRLRAVINREAMAQALLYPGTDSGVGDANPPPPPWTEVEVLDAGAVKIADSSSWDYVAAPEAWQLTSEGGRIGVGTEDSFAGYEYITDASATTDYTLTACIQISNSINSVKPRAGIAIRDGAATGDRMITVSKHGSSGVYINWRTVDDGAHSTDITQATEPTLPEGFRFELDRAIPSLKIFQSDDCSTGWTEIFQSTPAWLSGQALNLYLFTSPQDKDIEGLSSNATFDTVSVSTASVDHSGAGSSTIDFDDAAPTISEESTPLSFSVTRNGSGSGTCNIDADTSDGTATAGTDYTTTHCDLDWTAGQTTTKTCDVAITDRNAVNQGNLTFDLDLTAESCTDTISVATATATIIDQDSAGSFAAHTHTYDSIMRSMACFGCDWTTFLATAPTYEVIYISNLNLTGAGSMDACFANPSATTLRFCVPRTSGKITYPADSSLVISNPVVYVGQAAPSPGLHVQGASLKISGNNVLIMHFSQFGDATKEGTGKGVILGGQTATTEVVIANSGFSGNYDSNMQFFRNVTKSSFVQTMALWPQGEAGAANQECCAIGDAGHNDDEHGMYRIVSTHNDGRVPKLNGGDNTEVVDSVFYNSANSFTQVSKSSSAPFNTNLEGILYVYGAAGSPVPVKCQTSVGPGTQVYMNGNRTNGGGDDSTQAAMFDNDDAGDCTLNTSSRVATRTPGYTVEPAMGAGEAGERARVVLIGAHAGPRTTDRIPWYDLAISEILERIDTDAGGGGQLTSAGISSHPHGAYPTIAVNSCDPETAGDCNTGNPALPIADLTGADTHINKMWTWVNDVHCDVMPTGATGC